MYDKVKVEFLLTNIENMQTPDYTHRKSAVQCMEHESLLNMLMLFS